METELTVNTSAAPAQTATPSNNGATPADTTQATDTFFNPATLPPELKEIYNGMQAAYTKKTQQISAEKKKIEAYNQFMANPQATIKQLASQYGLTIAQATNLAQGQPVDAAPDFNNWEPQTWQEVADKLTPAVRRQVTEELMGKMQPVFKELQETKKNSYKKILDDLDPNWKTYEADMVELLQAHPSLSNDPAALYRLAVPEEIKQAKAVQAALQKLKTQASASAATPAQPAESKSAKPKKGLSIQEAWAIAKQKSTA
jgi:hypothetical protein